MRRRRSPPLRTNPAVYDGRYDDIQNQVVSVGRTGQPEAIVANRDPLIGTCGDNVTDSRHIVINNAALREVVGVQSEPFADPATFGVERRYRFGAS